MEVVTRWALTLKAAKGVDTVAPLAQPWQLLALINVCQEVRRLCLETTPKQRTQGTPMSRPELSRALEEPVLLL